MKQETLNIAQLLQSYGNRITKLEEALAHEKGEREKLGRLVVDLTVALAKLDDPKYTRNGEVVDIDNHPELVTTPEEATE